MFLINSRAQYSEGWWELFSLKYFEIWDLYFKQDSHKLNNIND